jgi:hypothetical protein
MIMLASAGLPRANCRLQKINVLAILSDHIGRILIPLI